MTKHKISEREISQNLLLAYLNLKQANECLKVLWAFRKDITNKKFVTDIQQTQTKISYFVRQIDNTLLSDPKFNKEHWNQIEDACYKCLEDLDEEIKKL